MKKLIDLDTAIVAVEKESQVDGAYGYMDTKSIVDLLNDLPSAQLEPCEDAVSRESILSILRENYRRLGLTDKAFMELCSLMKSEPSVTPKRKTGKWIDQKGGGCCCSECGRYALDEVDGNFIHVAAKSNFCPNCGADMR